MTRMPPAPLSARNTSPFGAVLISRGMSSPRATRLTLKPGSTCSGAGCGIATTDGPRAADDVANGAGRSEGVIRCTTPGASCRQSPNTTGPLPTPCANAGVARDAMRVTAWIRMISNTRAAYLGCRAMRCAALLGVDRDPRHPAAEHAERLRRALRQIDHTLGGGEAVGDRDDDLLAGILQRHPDAGAERQPVMSGRHSVLVEHLAACGAPPVPRPAVPRSDAVLLIERSRRIRYGGGRVPRYCLVICLGADPPRPGVRR